MPKINRPDTPASGAAPGAYLRRLDAAKRLGISVRSLERLAVDGGGPPFAMIGRIPLYPEAELHEWMRARLVTSTSAATVAARAEAGA
jgi:hypothetical protein